MGTTREVERTNMKEQRWEAEILRGEDHRDNKRDGDVMLYSIGYEVETEDRGATELLQMDNGIIWGSSSNGSYLYFTEDLGFQVYNEIKDDGHIQFKGIFAVMSRESTGVQLSSGVGWSKLVPAEQTPASSS